MCEYLKNEHLFKEMLSDCALSQQPASILSNDEKFKFGKLMMRRSGSESPNDFVEHYIVLLHQTLYFWEDCEYLDDDDQVP